MIDFNWAKKEFCNIDFGDTRLNRRFLNVTTLLSKLPSDPISKACMNWRNSKAAYRMFDNDKLNIEEILNQHRDSIIKRIGKNKYVLAIEDTTTANYHKHKNKEDLGYILNKEINGGVGTKGLFIHSTLITSTNGVPLGIFDQEIFRRTLKGRTSSWTKSIKDKESFKWLRPLETLKAYLPENIKPIFVADREGDKFPFMAYACLLEQNFLIRSCQDRVINDRSRRNFKGEFYHQNEYFYDLIDKTEVKGSIIVKIYDKKLQRERKVKLNIKFGSLEIPPTNVSRYHDNHLNQFACYFIHAEESGKKKDKIDWKLLTNLEVKKLKDAVEKIKFYQQRWKIEVFHKTLKSGCKIEDLRFIKKERYERAITLYSIIAWRILYLTYFARQYPKENCGKIFSDEEWKVLFLNEFKSSCFPQKEPNIGEVIIWLGKLGGYLNRKSDGPLGVTNIWRGLKELNNMVKTYEILRCG